MTAKTTTIILTPTTRRQLAEIGGQQSETIRRAVAVLHALEVLAVTCRVALLHCEGQLSLAVFGVQRIDRAEVTRLTADEDGYSTVDLRFHIRSRDLENRMAPAVNLPSPSHPTPPK